MSDPKQPPNPATGRSAAEILASLSASAAPRGATPPDPAPPPPDTPPGEVSPPPPPDTPPPHVSPPSSQKTLRQFILLFATLTVIVLLVFAVTQSNTFEHVLEDMTGKGVSFGTGGTPGKASRTASQSSGHSSGHAVGHSSGHSGGHSGGHAAARHDASGYGANDGGHAGMASASNAPASLRDIWKPGNRWVYRYQRTSVNSGEDEVAPIEYYMVREVESAVEDAESGRLMVALAQTGGAMPDKTIKYLVDDDCVRRADAKNSPVFCREGATRTSIYAVDQSWPVEAFTHQTMTVHFHREMGIVQWEVKPPRGTREVTHTMVGYRINDESDGDIDRETVSCYWSQNVNFEKANDKVHLLLPNTPEAYLAAREGLHEERLWRLQTRVLSPNDKARVLLLTNTRRTAVAFINRKGDILWSESYTGNGRWIKVGQDTNDEITMAAIGIENGRNTDIVLLNREGRDAAGMHFSVPTGSGEPADAQMLASPDFCYLRLAQVEDQTSQCADLRLNWPQRSATRLRGTLSFTKR